MNERDDARHAAALFAVRGAVGAVVPLGLGHINRSYVVTFEEAGQGTRYLLQRINEGIFPDIAGLMTNMERVTARLQAHGQAHSATGASRALTLIRGQCGGSWLRGPTGAAWRMFAFIEGARAAGRVEAPRQAYQVGRAFGGFQRALADFDASQLLETLPNFHDTPRRFAVLEVLVERDPLERRAACAAELDALRQSRSLASLLLDAQSSGAAPVRVAHNDAKFSNVLLDESNDKPLCVVDLDTVMPGMSLYDFGDMMRSTLCSAAEDERDLSRIEADGEFFAELARGYLEEAGALLTPREHELLVSAGLVITLEQAVRFLTDYMGGDVYYSTTRAGQNLDRARAQIKLLQSMLRQREAFERIARSAWRG